MPGSHEFDATLFKGGVVANASFFTEVPPEIAAALNQKGSAKVKGMIEDIPYRTSFISRAGGKKLLTVRKEIREAIHKTDGDSVHVTIEADQEARVVDVPQDLAQALIAQGTAQALYNQLSFSHQKEYVDWITGAKKAETRQRRIEKMLQMLADGIKSPKTE